MQKGRNYLVHEWIWAGGQDKQIRLHRYLLLLSLLYLCWKRTRRLQHSKRKRTKKHAASAVCRLSSVVFMENFPWMIKTRSVCYIKLTFNPKSGTKLVWCLWRSIVATHEVHVPARSLLCRSSSSSNDFWLPYLGGSYCPHGLYYFNSMNDIPFFQNKKYKKNTKI